MSTAASLDDRSRIVLRAAVEQYIASAEPVASRSLGGGGVALSPASIRAVMARLEQCGLLFQPHTSAGRVPTTAGYRTYVDELMAPAPVDLGQRRALTALISAGLRELLQTTANALSMATGFPAFAVSAVRDDVVHRHVELVRLRAGEVLGIFATWNGTVHQRVVYLEGDISQGELDRFQNYLNARFEGLTLREIRASMRDELEETRRYYETLSVRALELGGRTLPDDETRDVDIFACGHHNLLAHPEFSSAALAAPVLEEMERRETWLQLLDAVAGARGVSVLIGPENAHEGLKQCTVVAAPMAWQPGVEGALGLVGPTRLAYATVIALVEFLRHYVADFARRGRETEQ